MSLGKREPVKRAIEAAAQESAAAEHLDLRLWLRLMAVHKSVKDELGRRLYQEFSMTLPRFDLMSHLSRQPKGMRMVELSRRLMVTNGNITGITDRLEEDGIVLRSVDPENRSAILITLTAKERRPSPRRPKCMRSWFQKCLTGSPRRRKSRFWICSANREPR
ncbi:MAG: MarR family transcriptional regulator [Rhodocyclaceae bacterium]|nr:MarR family transcriptional regulator [Rhodocyclaceae bacterium]